MNFWILFLSISLLLGSSDANGLNTVEVFNAVKNILDEGTTSYRITTDISLVYYAEEKAKECPSKGDLETGEVLINNDDLQNLLIGSNSTQYFSLGPLPTISTLQNKTVRIFLNIGSRMGCAPLNCSSGFDQYCVFDSREYASSRLEKYGCVKSEKYPNLCEEQPIDYVSMDPSNFQAKMMSWNHDRRAVAKKFGYSRMYEMNWSNDAAMIAEVLGFACEPNFAGFLGTHYYMHPRTLDPLGSSWFFTHDTIDGSQILGNTTFEMFAPDRKEFGCVPLDTACCSNYSYICVLGPDWLSTDQPIFSKGTPCDQCPDGCNDGLCVNPKKENSSENSAVVLSEIPLAETTSIYHGTIWEDTGKSVALLVCFIGASIAAFSSNCPRNVGNIILHLLSALEGYFNSIGMLFQLFSIIFLVAHCAAVTTITMVTKSPSETEMFTEVLRLLNDPRRSLIYDLNVSDLYWLKWDISLAWLAFKTTDTCEPLDDSDGFAKLRLTLSDKEIVTTTNNQETKTQHRIVSDLWENLDAFTEHIKEYGSELKNSREEFSKFYDYYRSDWTRIGCAFKVCKDVMTGEENNLICFLGPKADQKSDPIFTMETSKDDLCKNCECEKLACKEPPFDGSKLSDDEFQKKVLDEFNGARSKFSLGANVSAMSKLVWDDTLTASALDVANNCPGQVAHGTNYREILADTFLDKAAGLSSIGEMYGSTTTEQSYTEVYNWSAIYTILWPKMTKVGCARAPNTCANKIWCHFGDIGLLNGKMYEKGTPCSKCTGGCEDGFCT
ncbi:hypothetical protein L3Y34_005923 [Caenorhabditis briggsae]|uniref:SCP domain-containing protein n=1 Tax=Caenorhabditis briggsae TaxID=6238 RepID=A0AAE9CX88_CAEBR|nr:hypothetical protein L3Y34_005923 [Caenorhabditis briggsae]